MALAASLGLGAPALAEQHSSGFPSFLGGFPGNEPAAPPVVNDGRSLTLPSTKPPTNASPPAVETRDDFRVTGATVSRSAAAAPTALASPFAEGYNAPMRARAPAELVPYGGRIGLSRVPRSALSPLPPLAVQ